MTDRLGKSGPLRNNGLREKKTFWLDVIEGFICTIRDTKLWGCHPDWIYWKGLNGPRNDNTGSYVAKPTGEVVSIQTGWGVGRLTLGSGLSRCWRSFQSPKNISRVRTPDSSSYFLYYQFSFCVPFNQLKTSFLVTYLGEMDIETWLVLFLCNWKWQYYPTHYYKYFNLIDTFRPVRESL